MSEASKDKGESPVPNIICTPPATPSRQKTFSTCSCTASEYPHKLELILEGNLDTIVRIWHGLEYGSPIHSFLIERGFKDIKVSPWASDISNAVPLKPIPSLPRTKAYIPDSHTLAVGSTKKMTYIAPVPPNPLGLREAQVVNTIEVLGSFPDNYLCVTNCGENRDMPIPTINRGIVCMNAISEEKVRVNVSFRVEFPSRSFLKSIIEPIVVNEIKSYYQDRLKHVSEWILKAKNTDDHQIKKYLDIPSEVREGLTLMTPPSTPKAGVSQPAIKLRPRSSATSLKERPASRIYLATEPSPASHVEKSGSVSSRNDTFLILALVLALVMILLLHAFTFSSFLRIVDSTTSRLSSLESRLGTVESAILRVLEHR